MNAEPRAMTPMQYAKTLGVDVETVRGWIRSGELVAINTASSATMKPRWRITAPAAKAFEDRRSNQTAAKPETRPRRVKQMVVEKFF